MKDTPDKGIAIGRNCFKVQLAVKSKGKGKSGGARVITNFVVAEDTVYLLSVYDKSNKQHLTDKELYELLQYVPE